MNPHLTDQAVADLPLAAGRAELLEEIMSTPVLDDTTTSAPVREPRRVTRWMAPVAAAAAVLALVSLPAWWPSGDDASRQPRTVVGPATNQPAPTPAAPEKGYRMVLDAPGWEAVHVYEDGDYGELGFTRGRQQVEITWQAADLYASFVEDREHIVDPPAPGEPIEVLDHPAQLWHHSEDSHTVIRAVQEGHWVEISGSGMDDAAFRVLLGELRFVDRGGLRAMLRVLS